MRRRRALSVLGAAATAVAGYSAVCVADYRPYDSPDRVPEGPPNERITAANRLLHAVDHRAVTRVTVLADGTGNDPYPSTRYRQVHEHSRRRHLAVFTTLRAPPGRPAPPVDGLYALLHRSYVDHETESPPWTSVAHVTDGTVLVDWDAATLTGPDDPPRFDGADVRRSPTRGGEAAAFGEHVLPHRATWRESTGLDASVGAGSGDGTVTYYVDDRDAYARVPPLLMADAVHDGSRIAATLDAETGFLRRLLDRRVVTKRVTDDEGDAATRRFTYRIETTFDRSGEATAPRPDGAPFGDLDELDSRGVELARDLRFY